MAKTDPTNDPEFQKVVKHFLTTPPKRHEESKIGKQGKQSGRKPVTNPASRQQLSRPQNKPAK
jgi:hypothetical protein